MDIVEAPALCELTRCTQRAAQRRPYIWIA